MTPISTPAAGAGPIADVSYRSYDGPLQTRAIRWWIVVVAGLRLILRRPGFWIVFALAVLPYLWEGGMLYLRSQEWASNMPMLAEYPAGQKYASSFFGALDGQWLWLLVVALMVGAGSIAADNRTNALLVYLSRPLTKGDYLFGKWVGIFLVVFSVAVVPALVLYLFCLISFLDEGFLKDEPWLLLRIIGAATVPAAVHASLLVGFSAWSKTPRVAGASYAALFFVGNLIAGAVWLIGHRGDLGGGILTQHLSVGGTIKGLAQNIYGFTRLIPSGHRERGLEIVEMPPPDPGVLLVIAVALVLLGVAAARARIRAVEVIRG